MRLLLDESLPWRLARLLEGHHVESVQRAGWAGISNGTLLKLAATTHDAFITADQSNGVHRTYVNCASESVNAKWRTISTPCRQNWRKRFTENRSVEFIAGYPYSHLGA